MIERKILLMLGSLSLALISAMLLTPCIYGPSCFVHLDGTPGMIDHDWSEYGAGSFMYLFGDILCHQEMDRSFIINGSQMPFCIRDTGLLAGFMTGCFSFIFRIELLSDKRVTLLGAFLIVLTLVEWCFERFAFGIPELRFIVAIASGIGFVMVLGWFLKKISEGQGAPHE